MENRGQKRAETMEELPADKRACNILEFRPSSSNSSAQTIINSTNSTHEPHEHDTDVSSSNSDTTGEGEKDSAYGSCDSDYSFRGYQPRQSSGDHGKFKRVLSTLSEEADQSGKLAALTELCELLSFCSDSSLPSMVADSLSPILVKLASHANNPDVILLAIRAITYLCDVHPRSSAFLVRHDVVPAVCQRLMDIEYFDVAEQCLQALEKISREQPLACLHSGAIMAVLSYIDFFSTSVQRVALSTVVNICKKLPSESPSPFMEAVPILCKLLQYEDRQLVENVATCLIKIAERVCHSSEMLDELCKHDLPYQVAHLIELNTRTPLSQPIFTGLIGLLVKLASGSIAAVRILFELNISFILKEVLHMPSPSMVDGHCYQVHEVLKLLNELLPAVSRDKDVPVASEKEALLVNWPDFLEKLGMDLLPVLIQVVDSGANLYVCYCCLSVINKIVYFSKSGGLLKLLNSTNISSFLAGVFTRKDHHVLILALQIVDTILEKLSDTFLNSFIKEGVIFAVDAIFMPENCSHFTFPMFSSIQMSLDASRKTAGRDVMRCLCYAFDTDRSSSVSDPGTCRLNKDSIHDLAKHIRTSYFATELPNPEDGLTDVHQKFKLISAKLTELVNMPIKSDASTHHEEELCCILRQIVSQLSGRDYISTFEFVESGIVKALMTYLSNGQYLNENLDGGVESNKIFIIEKRFEVFGKLLLSSPDFPTEDCPAILLIHRLKNALASVENFPVNLSHFSRPRSSYATVPYGRCTQHACLRVQFVREEGEASLSDYSKDVVTVDPFSHLDEIERYLLPRVVNKRDSTASASTSALTARIYFEQECSHLASGGSGAQGKIPYFMELESMLAEGYRMQEDMRNLSEAAPGEAADSRQTADESTSIGELRNESAGQEDCKFVSEESSLSNKYPQTCSNGSDLPKLLFYIEGQPMDKSLTLYQAILQQQMKVEHDMGRNAKFWSQVYRVTYRRAVKPEQSCPHHQVQCSSVLKKAEKNWCYTPILSGMFSSELASVLEKCSPAYDILFLLKCLEGMSKFRFHLMCRERIYAFAEGKIDSFDKLKVPVTDFQQNEFVSNKLTEKLEQQIRDALVVSVGGLPAWCTKLMDSCPFLFAFDTRCKYFKLAAFGQQHIQPHPSSSHNNSGGRNSSRQQSHGALPRKKFLVYRDQILASATRMMDIHAREKGLLEVEYDEEVGTGLGPTLEFYTLVSHEFQKPGLGMWREDNMPLTSMKFVDDEHSNILVSTLGLFPRPWSSAVSTCGGIEFSEVTKKFVLLGQVVAKALQDGRVLDIPLSKAFCKVILGQELTVYDIQSFDPELGRVIIEFLAIVERKRYLESLCEESILEHDLNFRNTRIEDLCLDFTLPGYPDYLLKPEADSKMVNMSNLEEYVSLIADATINSGISRQLEAFKSGFDQVFPIRHIQIFTEEELEHLLCGERECWNPTDLLDHIKFDHGYTASSSHIIYLLEIMREFERAQQRAFLQFVTGAPRLPPGGLASLNPKLTIVRKHCGGLVDADLPSVMTCANYLKLPPYSSKERMKERMLYAIVEGQGAFHLS